MQKLWTRDFILVTLSTFFVFLNMQMVTPTLSTYIKSGIGGNSVIGLSTAAWAVSAVVTRAIAGKALIAMSKQRVMWIGIAVFLCSTAGYYFVNSVATLIVIRVLYGIGFGLTTTTFGTIAADVVPSKRMGEGMGYFGLSTSLAMAIAPLIGISLYNGLGFNWLVCAITVLALLIVCISPCIGAIKPSRPHPHLPASGFKLTQFYDRRIVLPCVLLLFMSITYGGLVSFITLYGQSMQIANVGWFFLAMAGAIVVIRPFSGRIFDSKGHVAVLPAGALMLLLALLLLSFAQNIEVFLLAAVLYGCGYGILQPALQAWIFQRLAPERRGIGSGAFFNAMDLGIAVGSVVLGCVANVTDYAVMYRLSSICIATFLLLYAFFGLRNKPETMNDPSAVHS